MPVIPAAPSSLRWRHSPYRREQRGRQQQRVAGRRDHRRLPLGDAPFGVLGGERAPAEDAGRHEERERRERAPHDRAQPEQAQAELDEEEERHHLDDAAEHDQAVDHALADVALLDRHEDVAPDREGLDEGEAGQPDQRRGEGQACGPPALQPDGEAEREEDQPLREQDDGLVLNEELAQVAPSGRWLETPRRAGTSSIPARRASSVIDPLLEPIVAPPSRAAGDPTPRAPPRGRPAGARAPPRRRPPPPPRAPPGAPGGRRGCCG